MKAIALLLLVLAQGEEFKEFTSKADGFAANFPGEPKKRTQKIAGGRLTQTLWGVETKEGAFQVFAQPHPGKKKIDFDTVMRAVIKRFEGKLIAKKDFVVQGNKGREYEIKIAKPFDAYLCTRLLVANGRFYQVQFLGKLRRSAPQVQKFLTSFKLTQSPK